MHKLFLQILCLQALEPAAAGRAMTVRDFIVGSRCRLSREIERLFPARITSLHAACQSSNPSALQR